MARLETEHPHVLIKRRHRNVLWLSPARLGHCWTVSGQGLHFGEPWRDSLVFYAKHSRTVHTGNSGVRTEAGKCSGANHWWSLGTGSHQTTMWSGLENPVFLHKWMKEVQVTSPVIFPKLHWTAAVTGALHISNRVTSEIAQRWVSQVFTSLKHLLLSHIQLLLLPLIFFSSPSSNCNSQ